MLRRGFLKSLIITCCATAHYTSGSFPTISASGKTSFQTFFSFYGVVRRGCQLG